MRAWLLIALLAGASRAAEAAEPCSGATATAEVETQFALKTWDATAQNGLGDWMDAGACGPDKLVPEAASALLFLKNLPPLASRSDDFDPNRIGTDVFAFFQTRIGALYFDVEGPSCPPDTMAYVSDPESHSLHLCPYAQSFSSLTLSSVLMHESRHIEGYPHVTCDHGDLVGAFACDRAYDEGGAYGIGEEFMVRIARDEGLNDAIREEARASAVADFLNRFNAAPLGATEGMLLLSSQGELEFFDGSATTSLLDGVPATTVVSLRDLPVLFDTIGQTVKSVEAGRHLQDTDGPLATEYRALSADKKAALVDVIYADTSCFLFTTSAHCEYGDDAADLPLPAGVRARQFLDVNPGDPEYDTIDIVAADGQKFTLPTGEALKTWAGKPLEPDTSPSLAPFLSFAMLPDSRRYAIGLDGTLLTYSETSGSWEPVASQSGKKYVKLIAPFFWSDRLGGI